MSLGSVFYISVYYLKRKHWNTCKITILHKCETLAIKEEQWTIVGTRVLGTDKNSWVYEGGSNAKGLQKLHNEQKFILFSLQLTLLA
jgi:hypothetical protein